MTKMERLVFKVRRFHLDRQVVHTEPIVQFHAQRPQQFRLRNTRRVNHVRAQRFTSGSNGPNVQIVNVRNTIGREDRIFNRSQIDVRRRALQKLVGGFANDPQ